MTDLATLGMVIDSSQVPKGVSELDKLTAAGARAEAQTTKLTSTTKTAGAAAAQMAAQAQAASRAAVGFSSGATTVARTSGLAAYQAQNLAFQLNDVATGLASGQAPMRVLAQQGGQFYQIMQQSGLGVKGFAVELLKMVGILKVTRDAELAETAANAAAAATAVRAVSDRAKAAIAAADTELTLALAAVRVATTSEAEAAAQLQVAAAHEAVAAAAGQAAIAESALAEASARAAAANEASNARTVVGIGRMGTALGVTAIAAGVLFAAMEGVKQSAADDTAMQAYAKTLGLTQKEMKKLEDVTVTWGDVTKATFQVLAEKAGIDSAAIKAFFGNTFHSIGEFGKFSVAVIVGAFGAMVKGVADVAMNLPAIIGGAFTAATNLGIAAIEKLVNFTILGLNKASGFINNVFGTSLGTIADVHLPRLQSSFGTTMKAIGADVSGTFHRIFNQTEATFDEISARATKVAKDRLTSQAEDMIADRTNKAAKAHKARAKAAKEEKNALDELLKSLGYLMNQEVKLDGDLLNPRPLGNLGGPDLKDVLGDLPDYGKQLLDMLQQISAQAQITGQALTDAFGNVGSVFGNMLTGMAQYAEAQERVSQEVASGSKTQAAADKELANLRAHNTAAALSGLKSLFKEHSTGYKVMSAIEKAYAVFQAATTIAAMVRDATHTASSVANSATRAAADEAAGASKIFAQLGVYAFPVVAAMVALLATFAFGGKGGGGGGAPSVPTAEDVQAQQGAGTVLGDAKAKSASIADALELMAKNSTTGLDYSSDMVSTLRSISSGIGNLAASLARSLDLKGGFFDTTGKTGTNTSGGLFGIGGLFSTTKTTSLFDQGVQFSPSTVQQIIANGISGATYQVLETVKHKSGFLGIGGSTKTSYKTNTGALDDGISQQIQLIIGQLYTSVVQAAKVLGLDVAAALQAFQVEIGKISFKDMTGDQITDALNAVFSKVGDQMAGFAVEGLAGFQKAGEGLFETLMRLAKDYLTIDAALKSIGMTFGSVGSASLAARERLIDLAGGLDAFTDQVNFFYDHFLSDADKLAFAQAQVDAAFKAMGVAIPSSIQGFTSLVQGLDLSTDAGQALFEKLMEIAPAFYDAATAADQLLAKKQGLQVQLLQAQGDTAGATALQRQIDLAKLDPALRDLQQQVYDAQDAATAAAAAMKLKNEQDQLQIQLLEAQGKASEALALKRQLELASMDESLRGLQEQIYHEQDIAAAKADLLTAYQRESAALKDTADKFRRFADDLKAFRDSLFASNDSTTSYNQALTNLMQQSGAAQAGDENALGGGLQDAAQKFLDIATQNAGSIQDVDRARALVARYLDQAIGSAEKRASVAERQLQKLEQQVGKLVDIDDHVLTVNEAISALNKLLHDTPKAQKATETFQRKMTDSMDEVVAATREHAINSGKINKRFERYDRGSGMAVVTDSDSPLDVTGSATSPLPVHETTPA
jgi:hypothetical protein